MFYKLRKDKKQMNEQDTITALESGNYGILSIITDSGYPYGVPMNYVYSDGKIYLHGAKTGLRYDSILKNNKASFTVVTYDHLIEKGYTSDFTSVICFGKVRLLEGSEANEAIRVFVHKLAPNYPQEVENRIQNGSMEHVAIFELDIEDMTGKHRRLGE